MKVLAAPGLECPMEDDPRKHIPDRGDPVEVPDNAFYQRLIADGSLVLVHDSSVHSAVKKSKEVKHNVK